MQVFFHTGLVWRPKKIIFSFIGAPVSNKDKLCVNKKNQLDVTFVFFISLLLVAQHVSGNNVPIIRSWRLRDIVASCWYVPWLQEGCQDRLAGSASMDVFVAQL